jgi:hypothetical protein
MEIAEMAVSQACARDAFNEEADQHLSFPPQIEFPEADLTPLG